MNSNLGTHRLLVIVVAAGALILFSITARAQSVGELNSQNAGVVGQVGAAESSESTAGSVISRLDQLEAMYAKIASDPKSDKMALGPAYNQLESALSRLYNAYKKKKDDCIEQIDSGGQCDYTEAEKLSLQALYPLSWLRFQGATSVYANNDQQAKKLLNQAIDGFTESTLVIVDPNLVRENLLGRAYCERELGKFEHAEYDKAIADFKKIMEDGTQTAQYKAANQGLATTYSLMGKPEEAQRYTQGMASTGGSLM